MSETNFSSSNYQSYLVRLWRPSTDAPWRATARHVLTGEEWHFEDMERLFLFLHLQTNGAEKSDLTKEFLNL
ncbi:MAG: hypothetical protein H6636_03545 [Anaerolineales bacterium]|nr:hypothetical protein [Anaerolineales bacterium]